MTRSSRSSGNGFPHPAAAPGAQPVAVFDIGGTWFRSAVWESDGRLSDLSRRPASNYKNTPHEHPRELQRALVEYLVRQVDSLRRTHPSIDTASVSLGAALNGNTGEILQASPLWGPESGGFPLQQALEEARPSVRWHVVNDVTAALLRHVHAMRDELVGAGCPRVSLFTISTGIACRTFDVCGWRVPIDRAHGVQGEVGHLAIDFRFRGRRVESVCDCGGRNHVNAFSSGRGIERLARAVAASHPAEFARSALSDGAGGHADRLDFSAFAAAVAAGDGLAMEILDAACGPVADLIVQLLTYDPEVERVCMIGGAVDRLGPAYMARLGEALDRRGMYQVSGRDPAFFRSRVVRGFCDDRSGLAGAGIYAQTVHAGAASPRGAGRWVRASRRVEYCVQFAPRLLDPGNDSLREAVAASPNDRRLVLMDEGAAEHYRRPLEAYFRRHRVDASVVTLATSEHAKTLETVCRVVEHMATFGLLRRSQPVLAVGGGVLTDVVGFAASIYRRGVPYVRVPTTLMGMVDAGVGVKTGVTYLGKNRLGSFYAPLRTLIDLGFLRTLGRRHLRSGTAEVIKIALVRDGTLFDRLDRHLESLMACGFHDGSVGEDVVRRSVEGMLQELEPNLFEDELRRRVDFGHSFSPALEAASDFKLLHGEAVALDMALSAVISHERGLLCDAVLRKVLDLLARAGLPLAHDALRIDTLANAIRTTLEHRDGRQRLPLLAGIGEVVFVDDVSPDELRDGLAALAAAAAAAGSGGALCDEPSPSSGIGEDAPRAEVCLGHDAPARAG